MGAGSVRSGLGPCSFTEELTPGLAGMLEATVRAQASLPTRQESGLIGALCTG